MMDSAVRRNWSVGVPRSDYRDEGPHVDHVGVCVGPCGQPHCSHGLSGWYDMHRHRYGGFLADPVPDYGVLDWFLVAYG